ncbi:MAG: TauD/TfdA family dioxygenase [Nevskiales bacterium]
MYKSLRAQTLHYFARPHERVPSEPLKLPAAWRGAEMRKRGDWRVQLSTAEIQELKSAVQHAQTTGKPLGELSKQDFPLPTLAARIDAWRHEIRHGRGFVLIRGVPVQDWSDAQSSICYWCFGHYLGIPGAQNPQGDLLGHVRDQQTNADVRFYRTNKNIAVHCDAADIVGLLCLQPAKSGGLSRIASSVAVYNELLRRKPQLAPRLFKPFYFDTKGEGGIKAFPIAPCAYADGELRTFWQSDYYRSASQHKHVPQLTGEEQELLDAYDAIAESEEFYLDMELQPGDIQLLSNHSMLHARTAFEDWPEPERRRHLLRLWISLPEKRPLKTRLQIAQSWAGLFYTSTKEILRNRLAA